VGTVCVVSGDIHTLRTGFKFDMGRGELENVTAFREHTGSAASIRVQVKIIPSGGESWDGD
jgi:hypothetical protein